MEIQQTKNFNDLYNYNEFDLYCDIEDENILSVCTKFCQEISDPDILYYVILNASEKSFYHAPPDRRHPLTYAASFIFPIEWIGNIVDKFSKQKININLKNLAYLIKYTRYQDDGVDRLGLLTSNCRVTYSSESLIKLLHKYRLTEDYIVCLSLALNLTKDNKIVGYLINNYEIPVYFQGIVHCISEKVLNVFKRIILIKWSSDSIIQVLPYLKVNATTKLNLKIAKHIGVDIPMKKYLGLNDKLSPDDIDEIIFTLAVEEHAESVIR